MANILVVDDEKIICRFMKAAASSWGHTVTTALDVTAAEKRLQTLDIDLVITDFNMPGRNGLALIELIRSLDLRLPILVHSASGRSAEMLAAGADQVLPKPADLASLKQAITHLLNTRDTKAVRRPLLQPHS